PRRRPRDRGCGRGPGAVRAQDPARAPVAAAGTDLVHALRPRHGPRRGRRRPRHRPPDRAQHAPQGPDAAARPLCPRYDARPGLGRGGVTRTRRMTRGDEKMSDFEPDGRALWRRSRAAAGVSAGPAGPAPDPGLLAAYVEGGLDEDAAAPVE